jgi:glycosyltransferase involved in cell wall biosynthesis
LSKQNSKVTTYTVFDGLHWESTRGLGRFAGQLRRHLARMSWKEIGYPRPQWKSPVGRILLHEVAEPFWSELSAPELAFYPHNLLPFVSLTHRSVRVLILHDVLFLDRDNKSAGNRYRSAKLRHSLAQTDVIITVSEASRAEILKLENDSCQVLVIPNALADRFNEAHKIEKRQKNDVAKIFHFGGHARTKNTRNVFRAVALLNQNRYTVHLVLAAMAGQSDLIEKWRQETGLSNQALSVLPLLSDAELQNIYAEVDAHCMPSTGEGFGIPVIEAARLGTPNVLSPLPVFQELVGEDAIYTDSLDAESIAQSITKCLTSDTYAMTVRARERTEKFLFESVHRTNAAPVLRAIEEMAIARARRNSR